MALELLLKRSVKTNLSTIGKLSANGKTICYTLEDTDRGLTDKMSIAEIAKKKIKGKTAIPTGRYKVAITLSTRFNRYMPQILNVPGFEGIRIHSGNTAADTEGCPLTGLGVGKDMVTQSKDAYNIFFPMLDQALKTGTVYITVE